MNESATTSDALWIRLRREADARARQTLAGLDPIGLAWLAIVPEWTMAVARAVRLPVGRGTFGSYLDSLSDAGFCESRTALVPGELELQATGSNGSAPGDAAQKAPLLISTNNIRFRSDSFALTALRAMPLRTPVTARFRGFDAPARDSVDQPHDFLGEIVRADGDDWVGYALTVSLADKEHERFATELYPSFAVPESRRGDLVRLLGPVNWLDVCQEVTKRLVRVEAAQEFTLPPTTRRWLRYAARLTWGVGYVAGRIARRVRLLLRFRLAAETQSFLDAMRLLALPLGGEIETAVRLGERRLELYYRENIDERRLKHFLEAGNQLTLFQRLLRNETPGWALHYVGVGGAGKTMLMRYINRDLRRQSVAVARIDFDYISADYPVKLPAQLLLELADSLRLYIQSEPAEAGFRNVYRIADEFHRDQKGPLPNPLARLHTAGFTTVRQAFADFVRSLNTRVVLILDTCEELARLQADGSFQPGVQATFQILEDLRRDLSPTSLFSIFAGRRILALRGNGWQVKGAHTKERQQQFTSATGEPAAVKDFLLLHEIRGFSEDESLLYLRKRANSADIATVVPATAAPTELEQAILRRSANTSSAYDFEWLDDRAREKGRFYNPFELSLYAELVADSPRITAADLEKSKADPYVELRIIGRLRNPMILNVLPLLCLLRRVQRPWLHELMHTDPTTVDNLYRDLCQVEWMDYQVVGQDTAWLEVDHHLRHRLERYFNRVRSGQLATARRLLNEWLQTRIDAIGEGKPDQVLLSAAVRLLPALPAVEFWQRVDAFVARDGDWHWAIQVCDHLLADEGPVPDHLTAAMSASLAAAYIQTGTGNALLTWQKVAASARHHPKLGAELRDRAFAGEMVARMNQGVVPTLTELRRLRTLMKDNPASLWGAVIEALVNHADRTGANFADGALTSADLSRWYQKLRTTRQVKAVVLALCLRAQRLIHHDGREAAGRGPRETLEELTSTVSEGFDRSPPSASVAPDWLLPVRLEERLRLEVIDLMQTRDGLSANLLRVWRGDAIRAVDHPDSRWLLAKLFVREHLVGDSDRPALQRSTEAAGFLTPDRPETPAQRRTEYLFVVLAEAWSILNQAERALEILDRHLNSSKLDAAMTEQAFAAKARLLLRHRLRDRVTLFLHSVHSSNLALDPATANQLEELIRGPWRPRTLQQRLIDRLRRAADRLGRGTISTLGGLMLVGFATFVFGAAIDLEGASTIVGVTGVTATFFALASFIRAQSPRTYMYLAGISRCAFGILFVGAVLYVAYRGMAASVTSLDVMGAILVMMISYIGIRWFNTWEAITRKGGDAEVRLELEREPDGPIQVRLREQYAPESFFDREWAMLKAVVAFWRSLPRRQVTQEGAVRAAWHSETEVTEGVWPVADGAGRDSPAILNGFADRFVARLDVGGATWIPLAIRTDEDLAEERWEVRIDRWLQIERRRRRNIMPFRQAAPLTQSHLPFPWRRRAGPDRARVYCWPQWERTIHQAWRAGQERWLVRMLYQDLAARVLSAFEFNRLSEFGICHIVGEASRVHGSYRIRWSDDNDIEGSVLKSANSESLLLSERGLFILQELPAEFSVRSRTAQSRTAAMRGFAHELFHGGAWAVLVLPPLPPERASEATRIVAQLCNSIRAPYSSQLMDAVQKIRRLVDGTQVVPGMAAVPAEWKAVARELSWEVTLFARSAAHEFSVYPSRSVSKSNPVPA